jgi:hypothetical protein
VQQLLNAAWAAHAVRAMAALGLADRLAAGPRTPGALADATGAHAPTLARFLRTLAALGLCATEADGRVRLTPRGEVLRADAPGSVRPYALAIHAPHVDRAWDDLPEAVRTGEPAFPRVHGLGLWDYLAERTHRHEGIVAAERGTGRSPAENDRGRTTGNDRPKPLFLVPADHVTTNGLVQQPARSTVARSRNGARFPPSGPPIAAALRDRRMVLQVKGATFGPLRDNGGACRRGAGVAPEVRGGRRATGPRPVWRER